jgi:hypothetical protein
MWHSHAGVPFWEKWGAVPAALIVHRLEAAQGSAAVAKLIQREPFSLFLAYETACKEHADWPKLPAALLEDAHRGLDALRD